MSNQQDKIKTYLESLTQPLNQMIQSCDEIIKNIKNTKDIEEFEQITDTIEKKKNENDTYKKNEESKTGKLINFLSGAPKQGFKGVLNLGKGILGTAGLAVGAAGVGTAAITTGVLGGVQGAVAGASGYRNKAIGVNSGFKAAIPFSYFTKTKAKATAGGGKKTKKHNKRKKTQKRQKIQKRQKKLTKNK